MTLADRLRRAFDDRPASAPLWAGDIADDDDAAADAVPAAVLVAITDRPEPGLLLTVRHPGLRRHAGQVAFPGGRIDPEDADAIMAALREAEEEIGLPRALVDVVGMVDRYRTITGYVITPVIGVVPPDLPLMPNIDEVDLVFEVPLGFVFDEANRIERAVEWQGIERRYLEIGWEGQRIWGATAAMIANLAQRLAAFA